MPKLKGGTGVAYWRSRSVRQHFIEPPIKKEIDTTLLENAQLSLMLLCTINLCARTCFDAHQHIAYNHCGSSGSQPLCLVAHHLYCSPPALLPMFPIGASSFLPDSQQALLLLCLLKGCTITSGSWATVLWWHRGSRRQLRRLPVIGPWLAKRFSTRTGSKSRSQAAAQRSHARTMAGDAAIRRASSQVKAASAAQLLCYSKVDSQSCLQCIHPRDTDYASLLELVGRRSASKHIVDCSKNAQLHRLRLAAMLNVQIQVLLI